MTPKVLLVLDPGTVPSLQGTLAKLAPNLLTNLLEHKELIELKCTHT